MNNVFASDCTNSRRESTFQSLKSQKWEECAGTEGKGYVFTDEFLTSDWDSVYIHPNSLPVGEIRKGMRKVTRPTLVLKSHRSEMAFILATDTAPVYFCSYVEQDAKRGYTMLFSNAPDIWPEYFFYVSKYRNGWAYVADDSYGEGLYSSVGSVSDGPGWSIISYAEFCFLSAARQIRVPDMSEQERRINEAKTIEQSILSRLSEAERRHKQKEWLNETHIRNSKHRLSNAIFPIRTGMDVMEKFLKKHEESIGLNTIIGECTGLTIGKWLSNLNSSISRMEEEIDNLTRSEHIGESVEIIDVKHFVQEYGEVIASKFNQRFEFQIECSLDNMNISISRKSFMELLDCVVDNAVRHGFTEDRNDYFIHIHLAVSEKGWCRIEIANNGNPMSERGRREYFAKGSFAGETGHTGIGGARVYEICEQARGNAIEPYATAEYPVVVAVEFPLVSK